MRIGLAWLLVLGLASSASGAEIEGVRFEDRMRAGDTDLELRGTALMRWAYVFKVYLAGLYVAEGDQTQQVLDADVARRLEIVYLRGFSAEDFTNSTRALVRRNIGDAAFLALEADIEEFNLFYADVQPGDRYALEYVPGRGTSLFLNGELLGSSPGAELSRALFSMWLGSRPIDEALKRDLMGS
jgi:hypothetical protein